MKYLAIVMILLSESVFATNATGKVQTLLAGRSGHEVYVKISSGTASCSTKHPSGYQYAVSLSGHEAGKEIYSTLLAAYIAGKDISIVGTNNCNIDHRIEDISYVILQ